MKQHLDGDEGDVDCVTSTGLVQIDDVLAREVNNESRGKRK
jgi:hypothetical protein